MHSDGGSQTTTGESEDAHLCMLLDRRHAEHLKKLGEPIFLKAEDAGQFITDSGEKLAPH